MAEVASFNSLTSFLESIPCGESEGYMYLQAILHQQLDIEIKLADGIVLGTQKNATKLMRSTNTDRGGLLYESEIHSQLNYWTKALMVFQQVEAVKTQAVKLGLNNFNIEASEDLDYANSDHESAQFELSVHIKLNKFEAAPHIILKVW